MKSIYNLFNKRFSIVLLLVAILSIGMLIFAILNIRFEYDITRLISSSDKDISRKINLVSRIGSVEQLLFDISLSDETAYKSKADQDQKLIRIAHFFVKQLEESNQFKSVFYKMKEDQMEKIQRTLYKKRFALYNKRAFDTEDFYSENLILKQLKKLKQKLISLEGIITKQYLLKDPLSITDKTIKNIVGQNVSYSIKLRKNILFSRDEKHILVISKTKFKSFDIEKSKLLFEKLYKIILRTKMRFKENFQIKYLGGHLYATNTADQIKSDLTLIFIVSTIGILFIYILSFRQLKILFITFIPILVGIISGLFALTMIFETINGITIIFGSTLIGICIDYSTHYFSSHAIKDHDNPTDRNFQAISRIKKSLTFGYLSTTIVFIVFLFSGLRFLKEIALFSAVGISVAFFITLFILPQFQLNDLYKPGFLFQKLNHLFNKAYSFSQGHWLIIALFSGVVLILSGILSFNIIFNNDISSLNYVSPVLKNRENEFLKRYGDLSSSNLIVITGKNIQSILEQNDKVYQLLNSSVEKGEIRSFFNIHPFLPSEKSQKQNIQDFLSLNWSLIKKIVKHQSQKIGFKNNAFDSFFIDINQLEHNGNNYITLRDVQNSPFASYLTNSLFAQKDGYILISYFKAKKGANFSPLISQIEKIGDDVFYANQVDLVNQVLRILKDQMRIFIIFSLLVITILLIALYRDIAKSLIALSPALFAIITTLGFLSFLEAEINIISVFAMVLLLGIGLDYGIFMLDAVKDKIEKHTPPAVVIAGSTTLLSFGILIISKNKAISSIGLFILPGILFAMLYSLFLVPVLVRLLRKGKTF